MPNQWPNIPRPSSVLRGVLPREQALRGNSNSGGLQKHPFKGSLKITASGYDSATIAVQNSPQIAQNLWRTLMKVFQYGAVLLSGSHSQQTLSKANTFEREGVPCLWIGLYSLKLHSKELLRETITHCICSGKVRVAENTKTKSRIKQNWFHLRQMQEDETGAADNAELRQFEQDFRSKHFSPGLRDSRLHTNNTIPAYPSYCSLAATEIKDPCHVETHRSKKAGPSRAFRCISIESLSFRPFRYRMPKVFSRGCEILHQEATLQICHLSTGLVRRMPDRKWR